MTDGEHGVEGGSAQSKEVSNLLEELRKNPMRTKDPKLQEAMYTCITFLDASQPKSSAHWFCFRTSQTVTEAATFLLRLLAYSKAVEFKQGLSGVLKRCPDCVSGYEKAKIHAIDTYLSTVDNSALMTYYTSVTKWEADQVTSLAHNLDEASSASVYHILANINLTQDKDINNSLANHPPTKFYENWPPSVPAGLLLLVADRRESLRSWATLQAEKAVPLEILPKSSAHAAILASILRQLQSADHPSLKFQPKPSPLVPVIDGSNLLTIPTLWSSMPTVLRLCCAKSSLQVILDLQGVNVINAVYGHLHDNDAHFPYVLASFNCLLEAFGSSLWEKDTLDHPQVIVDSIRDNPAFDRLIQSDPKRLAWYHDYLVSVWKTNTFQDSLPKMASYMCEDLQHVRYKDSVRAGAMIVFANTLRNLYNTARESNSNKHLLALRNTVMMHSKTIVAVAFHRAQEGEIWSIARRATRNLISDILSADSTNVHNTMLSLSSARTKGQLATQKDMPQVPLKIHDQIWKRIYASVSSFDADAVTMLTHAVATSAHLDLLDETVFRLENHSSKELRDAFKLEVGAFQTALRSIRTGYGDVISNFTGRAEPSMLKSFMGTNEAVKSLTVIMFSPSDELQGASQEVAIQAYDVVGRDGSFRAYLENFPEQALEGIFTFLRTVKLSVANFFEASRVSQSTVLCLTDIIDVLCNRPDGLLLGTAFEEAVGSSLPDRIMEFWGLMADTISLIYKRTPLWAAHKDSEEMVVWMRDALIFSRHMVEQYDVLQQSASGTLQSSMVQASPRKSHGAVSRAGKFMMGKMADVIREVLKWLKLTDVELLHQSVQLVRMILESFLKSQITPPQDALDRLKHFFTGSTTKHNLTRPQLATLEDSASPWLKDSGSTGEVDDEVEYLGRSSGKPSGKPSTASSATTSKERPLPAASASSMSSFNKKLSTSSSRDPVKKATSKGGDLKSKAMRDMREAHAARQMQLKNLNGPAASKALRPSTKAGGSSSAPVTSSENEGAEDGESSEDESGDEGGKGLAGLTLMQKSPKRPKPAPERRKIVMLDSAIRNPVKERFDAREQARRTQMRLKPDLTPLHRIILSWDYDHPGDEPPQMLGVRPPVLSNVPDSFGTHDDYRRIMQPLLTLECWSQVVKAKEEPQDQTTWEISGKQYVDEWLDLDITAVDALPNKWYLTDADVVLLRNMDSKGKSVLAKVQSFKQRPNGQNILACVRCAANKSDPGLTVRSKWQVSKVFSLNTLHREYAALMGLPYYDLFDSIMSPRPSKLPQIPAAKIQQTMATYRVNEPQATAILGSLETEGFALIQGPPGTGKTSTICGLAGAFLSSRPKTAAPIQQPGQGAPPKVPPKKLLVCAPSNAAIDEVARRLKDGVRDSSGKIVNLNVVRIGHESNINISVKDISLDFLVAQKLDAQGSQDASQGSAKIADLRRQLEEVTQERKAKITAFHDIVNDSTRANALDTEIKMLNVKRSALNHSLNQARDKAKDEGRAMDAARRKFRQEILWDADIICCTLSGAGHESLEQFDFETVVIDEAAQSIELSSLIPLKYRCKRCIMVGDPQQLAPTVLSAKAARLGYEQSLFVRIQKHAPDVVYLLSIQYRMHPIISALPSSVFYGGRLRDGPDMAAKTAQPWHRELIFSPYRFFNVSSGLEESHGSHSLLNKAEAQVAVALYARLRSQFSRNGELDYRIGVVSMYRGQVAELKRQFAQRFQSDILNKIDFHTVDGFQGQEKDIIILSCVRAGPGVTRVGFLADVRRMNVALTRSRSSLFILGHASTLERGDETWKKIVQDARTRSCLSDNVSPSLFTSNQPIAVPTANAKSSASRPSLPTTAPMDLQRPQDVKPHKSIAKVLATNSEPSGSASGSMPSASTSTPTPQNLQDDDGDDQMTDMPVPDAQHVHPPAPRPPPKRPAGPSRPKEPSLFIPSKKTQLKKRPADSSVGPANTKKRLTEEMNIPKP